jgi:hypothetical protein
MANILRIYDFELEHSTKKNAVTFYDLALEHPELQGYIKTTGVRSDNVKWKIVLDAFKHKFTNDLNKEKLKNTKTQRIVKRGYKLDKEQNVILKEIDVDNDNFLIYSTLNGGKITEKSVLEKVSKEENTLQLLNGDRIYDELFFLLHISFRCNKARLFTLTRRNNYNLDSTIKSYFEKNMFNCKAFKKSKWHSYVPVELQSDALNRTVINNIAITKTKYLNNQDLEDEYEIEIKLKSKKKAGFGKITQNLVDMLKKTHITINNDEIDDETGLVKFNITDPETKTNKSVVFGHTDDFIPKLALDDKEILNKDLTLDDNKIKSICLSYISYNNSDTF